MHRITDPAARFRHFLIRYDLNLKEEKIAEAVTKIALYQAQGSSYNAALHRYWILCQQETVIDDQICEECYTPFVSWDGRDRLYCCNQCKVRAENARSYQKRRK